MIIGVSKACLTVALVLALSLQAIAADLLVCPEEDIGMAIPASDTATPNHDCCDEPVTCQHLDCDHCSQCSVASSVGAVDPLSTHRFLPQKQLIALSRTELLTSCRKDVPFKPPRRS